MHIKTIRRHFLTLKLAILKNPYVLKIVLNEQVLFPWDTVKKYFLCTWNSKFLTCFQLHKNKSGREENYKRRKKLTPKTQRIVV